MEKNAKAKPSGLTGENFLGAKTADIKPADVQGRGKRLRVLDRATKQAVFRGSYLNLHVDDEGYLTAPANLDDHAKSQLDQLVGQFPNLTVIEEK